MSERILIFPNGKCPEMLLSELSNPGRRDILWDKVQLARWILGERKTRKVSTGLRPLLEPKGKAKFCAHCGNIAIQEAVFKVDENVILIERYCDRCIKSVK